MNPPSEKRRLDELDSLRGLAALSVVLGHFLHTLPPSPPEGSLLFNTLRVFKGTPLFLTVAGHEAVILFFLLSGFVLCLPWLNANRIAYTPYVVRRVFRIYVPYLAAVLFTFLCATLLYSGALPAFGEWVNRPWSIRATWKSFADHVLLVGSFKNAQFNPVIWSLVHEMRISLVFPFVVLILRTANWRYCCAAAVALSCVGVIANKLTADHTDYFYTLHYLGFFIVGFLLARHRHDLGKLYACCGRRAQIPFWAGAIGAYTYGHLMNFIVLQDWVIGIGAGIFILLAQHDPYCRRVLGWGVSRFLGKISYSLYLFHAVLLLAVLHVFKGWLPLWAMFIVAGLLIALVSSLSWRFVERTSIACGKMLSQRIENARAKRSTKQCDTSLSIAPSHTGNL